MVECQAHHKPSQRQPAAQQCCRQLPHSLEVVHAPVCPGLGVGLLVASAAWEALAGEEASVRVDPKLEAPAVGGVW